MPVAPPAKVQKPKPSKMKPAQTNAWSELQKDPAPEQSEEVSYYSEGEESEYYDEEEDKPKELPIKPQLKFDPRKDKLLDISESNASGSMRHF